MPGAQRRSPRVGRYAGRAVTAESTSSRPRRSLPTRARSRGALSCPCVPRGRVDSPTPLSSSPPRQAAAVAALLLRLAASASTPALHHAKLSLLPARVCRRTEPSPASLPPHAGPCCFYAIHGYKSRPPLHLVHNCAVFTSGKPSPPHRLYFSTAPSVPSRLTPPLSPCAGPGAPQGPGAASSLVQVTPSPPLSSEAIDRAGELSPPRRPPS
jgi:hypothetical protein